MYQTMSYEDQLKMKAKQVKELLDTAVKNGGQVDENGNPDYVFEGIKGSPFEFAYRNKMEFSFGDEYKDGPLALGLHKKGSTYDVLSARDCKLVHEDMTKILCCVLEYFQERKTSFYKKMQHVGYLRHLLLRRANTTGEILVNLVTTSQEEMDLTPLKEALLALDLEGKIVGFLHIINDGLSDMVRSDETRILYGQDYFYEEILGLKFKVTPFSFFQPNSYGAEVLYNTAREYLGSTKDMTVFDLYSGTGTISQILAPVAKEVIGVEIVEEAVEAAKANASTRANGKEITVIGVNGSDSSKTAAASKKLDEVAPEIIGLEYQSETKAEHAKYFKIYHYDQGITLLEIDMSKKTGRKAAGKKWKQSSDTSGLNPAEQEQAALYLNKVVKYLIVPENAEIPAGLDKEVIVVRQPADHIYAGTNKIISKIAKLGQNDKVTAVGVKKKKCKNETIKEKMEKKEIIYTGKSGKLNYKKLVKNKCDLALLSSGILPKKGSSKKAARKKMKAYQKMTEKMTLLEMPVIVDRSKDEKGKDAKKEWEKVYQVILGCEDQSAE